MLVDLHVHTPASACYNEKGGEDTARRIIEKAKDVNLEMIAITDHHSVEWLDIMREASEQMSFPVIPGIEISMKFKQYPSVYFLALFPEETPTSKLRELLEKLKIPNESRGFCSFRVEEEPGFLLEEVYKLGGILISDHMDKTKDRRNFLPYLINEYDINLFEWKNESFEDEFKKIAKGKIFHSFVFSDSHSPDTVGKRKTSVPLKEASFKSLKGLSGK